MSSRILLLNQKRGEDREIIWKLCKGSCYFDAEILREINSYHFRTLDNESMTKVLLSTNLYFPGSNISRSPHLISWNCWCGSFEQTATKFKPFDEEDEKETAAWAVLLPMLETFLSRIDPRLLMSSSLYFSSPQLSSRALKVGVVVL